MCDYYVKTENELPYERAKQLSRIYRDESMKHKTTRFYKGFSIYLFEGNIWTVVIICQDVGDYTDRYEPHINEDWWTQAEETIEELLRQLECGKANEGKRFSPSDYDEIPF